MLQLSRESMTPEIESKWMLMFPTAIILRFSLFPGHIFADTKHGSAIRNSPSPLIADYFQFLKFQQAPMDGFLIYRPVWLLWGSAMAAVCVLVILLAFVFERQSDQLILAACVGSVAGASESLRFAFAR